MRILLIAGVSLVFLPTLFACTSGAGSCTTEYWVSTSGSDSATGGEKDPFLTIGHARDVVRADPTRGVCTVNVSIGDGTYRLTAPLAFGAQDSGSSKAPVVYKAASGAKPVISGGKQVTGWTLHNADFNIWQASVSVETGTMPRELYINGSRATRARTVDYPNYYYRTDTGYIYFYEIGDDPQIPPVWNNPTAVEAVTVTQWKMMRCPISSITGNSDVVMQNPCWNNANVYPTPWNFQLLSWWENAYEFLDQPGEWYLDPVSKTLYYIPLSGEDMAEADVELPVLETLLEAIGDASKPVSYLTFNGLTFRYATWLAPNTPDGYALDQSGFHLVGTNHQSNLIGHDKNTVRTPGNLEFLYAQNINFTNNTVEHMGAAGLDFGTGSQSVFIYNNTFNDISAAGIQLGGNSLEDSHPTTAAQYTKNNTISNNLVKYTGREYYDAPGIYIGFTTNSLVEHNEIEHTSWSGIAIGWGWALLDPGGFAGVPNGTPYEWGRIDTPSAATGNQIVHNHIQYFLEKLWDGGAIYSTGFQGTSAADGQLIAWNVAENKRPAAGGNTFYTDGGSRYNTLTGNVSINNPQGTVDLGPCLKASSFATLCAATGIVPYGGELGGCLPYGDMIFEGNYLRDNLSFYDICTNSNFPTAPYNMSFINNIKITGVNDVPASILNEAGRKKK